ncbi:PH domain-containing protein [Streptomyces sp. TP-A0874]|uniref:PH domain-containing protein n=1 Tax=Streptomyces sp. TP-A0874 TaxID=549819 RepID=UPI000852E3DC|nr:PH domain-containing protein [Streptomyces sp. TP-A0874]
MTSPDNSPEPTYDDRVYRSPSALVGGVALLVLAGWLGGDAVVRGTGRVPWLALAGLLCVVPLLIAFTLRPAVFAGAERLRIRNPFRVITLPWGAVEDVRASYTSEVFTDSDKYQLWSIPVSLRARKKASRKAARAAVEDFSNRTSVSPDVTDAARRAPADQAVAELRELAERHRSDEAAQGQPEVRWSYEVIVPSVVGLVLFVVLAVI